MSTRTLALALVLAGCGERGMLLAPCVVDSQCEPGLSCQDPQGHSVCYPDGTKGCTSSRECRSNDYCAAYGAGAFCRPIPTDDLGVDDSATTD